MASKTGGDVFKREQAEAFLYPAKGLPGGGQLEVRMEVSPDHPDPDIRGVARRVKFFSLFSVEDIAAGFVGHDRYSFFTARICTPVCPSGRKISTAQAQRG